MTVTGGNELWEQSLRHSQSTEDIRVIELLTDEFMEAADRPTSCAARPKSQVEN